MSWFNLIWWKFRWKFYAEEISWKFPSLRTTHGSLACGTLNQAAAGRRQFSISLMHRNPRELPTPEPDADINYENVHPTVRLTTCESLSLAAHHLSRCPEQIVSHKMHFLYYIIGEWRSRAVGEERSYDFRSLLFAFHFRVDFFLFSHSHFNTSVSFSSKFLLLKIHAYNTCIMLLVCKD